MEAVQINADTGKSDGAPEVYSDAQFVADLERASAPLKRLADEAVAEHKATKARLKAANP